MAKHRRRTFLIKAGLQLRYMGIIVTTMLMVACGVGWVIYFTSWSKISDTPDLSVDKLAGIFDEVNQQMVRWVAFFGILIAALSIFVSHKIAGPVYRFERSAHIIAKGDLTHRIKLRHGDELSDLQDAFNTMTESLRTMVCKDREVISRLVATGARLNEAIKKKKPDPDEIELVSKELYLIIEELRQATAGFKIDRDLATNGRPASPVNHELEDLDDKDDQEHA